MTFSSKPSASLVVKYHIVELLSWISYLVSSSLQISVAPPPVRDSLWDSPWTHSCHAGVTTQKTTRKKSVTSQDVRPGPLFTSRPPAAFDFPSHSPAALLPLPEGGESYLGEGEETATAWRTAQPTAYQTHPHILSVSPDICSRCWWCSQRCCYLNNCRHKLWLTVPFSLCLFLSLFLCRTVRAKSGPVFKGVCKNFSRSQGHGFIRPSHGGEDIFVHISEWVTSLSCSSTMN